MINFTKAVNSGYSLIPFKARPCCKPGCKGVAAHYVVKVGDKRVGTVAHLLCHRCEEEADAPDSKPGRRARIIGGTR